MSLLHGTASMPAIFIGHGNPMNAITDNRYSRSWAELALRLPKPSAILCISAHWETDGIFVTGSEMPSTIHDFYGFPKALFDVRYAVPGSAELVNMICEALADLHVRPDMERGLDHGAWSVLMPMFPAADVPVVQLSLDMTKPPAWHHAAGRKLAFLRRCGVLIVGSGNIVHNLRDMVLREDAQHVWAVAFDGIIRDAITAGDDEAVIHYERFGEAARQSIPTPEHFLPLLYVLAMRQVDDACSFFNAEVTLGSVSMRSVLLTPE